MPWAKCHGQNAMGKMSWAKCHGQNVMGKMSWAKCHGQNANLQNVMGKMPWAKYHLQNAMGKNASNSTSSATPTMTVKTEAVFLVVSDPSMNELWVT
jgi:hypothetical protein